jgi:luciferase family oxidoreductase group 1
MMTGLSILELGRVRQGSDRRTALDEARALARHAETWGYQRFWVAEHHNMPTVTTAATSLVIQHIAAGTTSIRVGAGGIMLPNHAPYVIAEQFGTLATLFPGRIDLGLGRAPGTDQMTLRALRRDPSNSDRFPQDVLELQAFLGPVQPGQRIEAVPGSDTNVPLWILGSSLFGAQLAAELGLPYGFASHFAPQALDMALRYTASASSLQRS